MSNSRIGRLRYIAYTLGFGLICAPGLLGGDMLTAHGYTTSGMVLTLIVQVISSALNIMLAVRRLHDFNARGWWAILEIPYDLFDPHQMARSWPDDFRIALPITLVILGILLIIYVLALVFRPGTFGPNRFGTPSPPNSLGVIMAATAGITLAVIVCIFSAFASSWH